jgi:hypothetical protein
MNPVQVDGSYGPPATYTLVDNWVDWHGKVPSELAMLSGERVQIVESSEYDFVHSTRDTYDFIFSDADHFHTDEWFDYVHERLLNDNGIMMSARRRR